MPIFKNSSPYDADVEKATAETAISENWTVFFEICDRIKQAPSSSKDAIKSMMKRLSHKNPHVVMHTLSLINACVQNTNKEFQLEMCRREFCQEIRTLLSNKSVPVPLQERTKKYLIEWSKMFENDPQLSMIPNLYNELLAEGIEFPNMQDIRRRKLKVTRVIRKHKGTGKTTTTTTVTTPQNREDDDLAKAIELSLLESNKNAGAAPVFNSATNNASHYPSLSTLPNLTASPKKEADAKKVRALYDFEAAEDNELTFKAGEIIFVTDDRDANWWRGENHNGVGLFPANFVTSDLSAVIEPEYVPTSKKVNFQENVDVVQLPESELRIDESKIDDALNFLQSADQSGETEDPQQMLNLEGECYRMGPLIDQVLEKTDRQHLELSELNKKLMDAFSLYNKLMTDTSMATFSPPASYGTQAQPMPMTYPNQFPPPSLPSQPTNYQMQTQPMSIPPAQFPGQQLSGYMGGAPPPQPSSLPINSQNVQSQSPQL